MATHNQTKMVKLLKMNVSENGWEARKCYFKQGLVYYFIFELCD